jgi:TetR/AcrR family transcriptional regulator, transcriptional repressor for nem operon
MPRPQEFDTDDARRQATRTFWERGYERVSVDDLVRDTKVSRYGLYGQFGSKHGLFLAALDGYVREVIDPLFGPVEAATADRTAIRDFFDRLVAAAESAHGRRGCLMCNSGVEFGGSDPEVTRRVKAYFARLRAGFTHALGRAKRGQPAAGELADYLVGVVHAVCTLARSPADREMIRTYVRVALDRL